MATVKDQHHHEVQNFSETVNFLWSVADLIRDKFNRSDYKDVILPFTVLRRLDCVLQPTKRAVLERHAFLEQRDIRNQVPQLQRASGYVFYNISQYDFERLLADHTHLADNCCIISTALARICAMCWTSSSFATRSRVCNRRACCIRWSRSSKRGPASRDRAQSEDGLYLRGVDTQV